MKRIMIGVGGLMLCIGGAWVVAQEDLPQKKELATPTGFSATSLEDQYSYAIGLDIGNSFRSSGTQLNVENLVAGLKDGLGGAKPKLDERACAQALEALQAQMQQKAMSQQQQHSAENRKMGDAFLAKNAQAEGVKVTKSGLQYKVIKSGDGPTPGLNDTVRCNYRGTLINGTVFDASAKHGGPAEFPVSGVITGWTEALQMMKVGDKWKLFIPADLAYKDVAMGPDLPAGSALIFDIELLGIVNK